jgi:integrase
MSEASMYRVIARYVARLPGAVKEGSRLYSTHSLRATTATLLLDAGVDIRKVQELLGHRHGQMYHRGPFIERATMLHLTICKEEARRVQDEGYDARYRSGKEHLSSSRG